MRITAAMVREKEQPFLVEELDLEEPRIDEVLVRVTGAGVCHTDLICRDQWYPVPLPAVVSLQQQGRFPFDRLVKFYDLDEINRAAKEAEEGSTLKPVLRVE